MPLNVRLIELDTVDSTNTFAKSLPPTLDDQDLECGVVVTAKRQTQGRGQHGRSWFSDDDGGLYYTLLIRSTYNPANPPASVRAGQAVVRAIQPMVEVPISLEWPNDLIASEKKIGGILVERLIRSSTRPPFTWIIGVGLNLHQTSFPPPLDKIALSLWQITKTRYDIVAIRSSLTKELTDEFTGN